MTKSPLQTTTERHETRQHVLFPKQEASHNQARHRDPASAPYIHFAPQPKLRFSKWHKKQKTPRVELNAGRVSKRLACCLVTFKRIRQSSTWWQETFKQGKTLAGIVDSIGTALNINGLAVKLKLHISNSVYSL
jgi:hypothetical protein